MDARQNQHEAMQRQAIATVDTAGRPLTVAVAGLAAVNLTYDPRGRLTLVRQAARAWRYAYDDSGRLATVRDTLGHTSGFAYDAAGRVVRQTLPGGGEVRYGYDASGNLAGLTPPGRPPHTFGYTPVDLNERYSPPAAGLAQFETRYDYDPDRALRHVYRADGVTVTLDYQPTTGRLAGLTQPRGVSQFSYLPTGQLGGISSPDGVSLLYEYEGPLLKKEEWSGPLQGRVERRYDAEFRDSTRSVNGSAEVAFGYDEDGLLTRAGALAIQRLATNGLVSGTSLDAVTSSMGYDEFGELDSLGYSSNAVSLFLESLSRDALGRIVLRDETVQGTRTLYGYRYDEAGRLAAVTTNGDTTARYGYDANGNRTGFVGATPTDTASADYDDQDRLLRYRDARYAYTAHGELSEKIAGTDTTRYTYDALGNLVTVILPNGDRLDYLVDGQNRRVGKQLNGRLTQGWLYQDGLRPVAELDSAGNVVSRYVWGSRSNVPEYVVKGTTTCRIVSDHLGSVRLVVEASSGAVAARLDYDAWGEVTTDTAPGFVSLGFAGGLYDPATGLVRFGARDYDASVGRWTARDPIGFSGGDGNLFRYVLGDPVDLVDPTGLLFGGLVDAGEAAGGRAAAYWAERSIDSNNTGLQTALYTTVGLFAILWTPCTSDKTFWTLFSAYGLRSFDRIWQLRDGSPAWSPIDYGDLFRLERHAIGRGTENATRWHVDAMWGLIRHWPYGF